MNQPQTATAPSDEISVAADSDSAETDTERNEPAGETLDPEPPVRAAKHRHVVAYLLVPLVVMSLAAGAGYLKYRVGLVSNSQTAAISSVQAATEGTIALLSYNPDTAQTTLTAARDLLTGSFRDSYTSLTNDVVIPGSKEKKISATATVPAAASVSASENRAVVLVYVDQSVIVGDDAPSATASAVQVTLDKAGNRWLISGFDPK
jgi:Mce-associated membrane protein